MIVITRINEKKNPSKNEWKKKLKIKITFENGNTIEMPSGLNWKCINKTIKKRRKKQNDDVRRKQLPYIQISYTHNIHSYLKRVDVEFIQCLKYQQCMQQL